jgi:crotonobetainyl-CoA hydratase
LTSSFLLPEVQIGMAPEVVTFMLPKLLPRQKANEILMTGRRISADELHRAGIINEVVPKEQLMDKVRELASDVLKASPLSLAARKEAIQKTEKLSFAESYAALRSRTWPLFLRMLESDDAREGAKAFLEGRAPVWKGR